MPTGREKDAWKFSNIINGKTYKAGENIIKNRKEYWWCPHHHDHGMWCRHQPATCIKNQPAPSPSTGTNDDVANAATEDEDAPEADEVQGLLGNFVIDSDDDHE